MSSILGNRVMRVEDPRMLTEGGMYVEDIALAGSVHVSFVRSQFAHGTILAIDSADAADMPGVLGIYTIDDIDLPVFPHVHPILADGSQRRVLASGTVRFVGEPIVAVVAETKAQATDAAEAIFVDIDPLPAIVELDDALADHTVIHPAIGTNVYSRLASPKQADFSGCEVVVKLRVMNQRLSGAPLEPRAGAAYWDGDRLVHYSACQGGQITKDVLCKMYGLPPTHVRVVVPDVGGGFGVKSRTVGEELALGWLSKQVGRPVRFIESRTESMQNMPQGRGQRMDLTIGGSKDGRVTAYQVDVVQDAGAYPLLGGHVLMMMTSRMVPGVYDIENCGFTGVAVATNKISTTAYRGAGRPEAALGIERAMEMFAAEIGMDPIEVRRKNFIPKFTSAYTTGIGNVYDTGDYETALDKVLEASDYASLRAEQAASRALGAGPLMGIGVATYVEITSGGAPTEHGAVHLLADGRLRAVSGATPYGQGHDTTWKMIVSDRAGVSMDDVDVIHGDTDLVPIGGLTVGSRSVQVAGSSLADATEKLVALARARAAEVLEAAVEDVVLDGGGFHVAGSPTPALTWADVAAAPGETLSAVSDFKAPQPTYPFGAHVAVVDVDRETGKVTLRRIIALDDAGTLVNPLLAEGQFHGGLGQGIAQAILEEQRFDDQGNPVTSNFADYPVISAAELPSFEMVHMETPTWVNPLGAKGAGESGTIGSIPAVLNAVIDAISPFGVRHMDGPATPERVWAAMTAARAGR